MEAMTATEREERYWLKQALDGARASLELRYKAYAILEEFGLSEALDYVRQWREGTR
jgi:hypothetical protein